MKFLRSPAVWMAGILLAASAWKLLFIFWDVVPFNADEAVVALMARHILAGARPIFFYGQAYMGSLDAYLVAAGFLLFGQAVWVIRLVQGLLYLGVIVSTYFIGKAAFHSTAVGLLAAALLVFPSVNVMLYTTASLGGYGEAMLIGNLLLLIAFWVVRQVRAGSARQQFARRWWLALFGWGLLAGLGLWANGLTLVYTLPAGLYLAWAAWQNGEILPRERWRRLAAWLAIMAGGALVGALPWIIYAVQRGPSQLILELFGSAVSVETAPWLLRTVSHLVNFFLLGTSVIYSFRPPWGIHWLALPLLPFVLVFWMVVLVFWDRRLRRGSPQRAEFAVLAGVCGVLLAGFLFTSFGVDPSGRYFLPLAVPLALAAAHLLVSLPFRPWLPAGLLVLVAGYHLIGTLQCALAFPPGLTTQFYEPTRIDHRADQALIDFLTEAGETRGYTNYWVAYPLAFRSQERLIFIPSLPYHLDLRYTSRDDRYAPYRDELARSERAAYITTRNPQLDDRLREQFRAQGITWKEHQIADFRVYYHLSRLVRPEQMDLSEVLE
jgi:4-amino-4-deoxy-L-arabinose transferase-like glycosyltransferase